VPSTVPHVGVQVTLFVVAVTFRSDIPFRSLLEITTPLKFSGEKLLGFRPVASVAVVGNQSEAGCPEIDRQRGFPGVFFVSAFAWR